MKQNVGKNTLGDNSKMSVDLKTYNRSTHDLSYVWRNTQAVGTEVPFLCELALPGDTWDIKLQAHVMTHPTVGPLFGSFKLQLDVFQGAVRLYQSWLHNNKSYIGLSMQDVKLPQLVYNLPERSNEGTIASNEDKFAQINPSCILSYLGIRGWGNNMDQARRDISKLAIPTFMYYDIHKNYYANLQEKTFPIINGGQPVYKIVQSQGTPTTYIVGKNMAMPLKQGNIYDFYPAKEKTGLNIYILVYDSRKGSSQWYPISDYMVIDDSIGEYTSWTPIDNSIPADATVWVDEIYVQGAEEFHNVNIEEIDRLREQILATSGDEYYEIKSTDTTTPLFLRRLIANEGTEGNIAPAYTKKPQYGLCLKTYNSDLFNNWIRTEAIDGENGVNAITAIDTSSGEFTLDTLNLAKKVYNMLNRIAISGGTYRDWIKTVYTNNYIDRSETPIFEGGMSEEIIFQEVVSNSATADEPLGTLAGRGRLSGNQKGGKLHIKVDEPAFLMGIVSITPRLDYNTDNRFYNNLSTMNDLHKPELGAIGFQDLLMGDAAWWANNITNGTRLNRKIGKQPAWIQYMTNYNRTYGNFATRSNEGFMCLNRDYEVNTVNSTHERGINPTSYIDPKKFNYIFADVDLSAMNFWVQIGVDIKARRVMTAKTMPNF